MWQEHRTLHVPLYVYVSGGGNNAVPDSTDTQLLTEYTLVAFTNLSEFYFRSDEEDDAGAVAWPTILLQALVISFVMHIYVSGAHCTSSDLHK